MGGQAPEAGKCLKSGLFRRRQPDPVGAFENHSDGCARDNKLFPAFPSARIAALVAPFLRSRRIDRMLPGTSPPPERGMGAEKNSAASAPITLIFK